MGNLIDSIGKYFERLLRWVYPGGLLLVLLWAYSTNLGQDESTLFKNLLAMTESWCVLFIGALFAGFAIYIIQSTIIDLLLQYAFRLKKFKGIFANKPAVEQLKRRADLDPLWFQGYPDYAWAVYHAASITGLMILITSISLIINRGLLLVSVLGIILSVLILLSSIVHWGILQDLLSDEKYLKAIQVNANKLRQRPAHSKNDQ